MKLIRLNGKVYRVVEKNPYDPELPYFQSQIAAEFANENEAKAYLARIRRRYKIEWSIHHGMKSGTWKVTASIHQ